MKVRVTVEQMEQFVEKLLHGQPGAPIGLGVVGDALAIVIPIGGVAKTMYRAAIDEQLPIPHRPHASPARMRRPDPRAHRGRPLHVMPAPWRGYSWRSCGVGESDPVEADHTATSAAAAVLQLAGLLFLRMHPSIVRE